MTRRILTRLTDEAAMAVVGLAVIAGVWFTLAAAEMLIILQEVFAP